MKLSPEFAAQERILAVGCGWVDVSHRTLIEVDGKDRTTFLQNLTTNDILALTDGEGRETFWLNVQGKVVGHGWVFCQRDRLWLATVPGQAEVLISHLDRYLIREAVTFMDRSQESSQVLLAGEATDRILANLAGPLQEGALRHTHLAIANSPVNALHVPAWAPRARLLVLAREDRASVITALESTGVKPCAAEALESHRLRGGFPAYGQDITVDNLPQEIDRDRYAISFTKGCYLGQETVARIDALGHVNRLLRCLAWDDIDELPPSGMALQHAGKTVGHVTSASWSEGAGKAIAMGYVRREHSEEGTALETELGTARVVPAAHRIR